jgi:3-hydroxy-9,10-secoandrosta-1,3,5(10)-triene-9,17-dione monooxygenase reductase component
MTIDPADFRKVLGHFPTGVMVVTGATDEGPAGMAIGSFASVSLDPPLVMFCPGSSSGTWQAIKETGAFCANILGEDQKDTCGVFAMPSDDRFAGIDWTTACHRLAGAARRGRLHRLRDPRHPRRWRP